MSPYIIRLTDPASRTRLAGSRHYSLSVVVVASVSRRNAGLENTSGLRCKQSVIIYPTG